MPGAMSSVWPNRKMRVPNHAPVSCSRTEEPPFLRIELGRAEHALVPERGEILELRDPGVHVALRSGRRRRGVLRLAVRLLLPVRLRLLLLGPAAGLPARNPV